MLQSTRHLFRQYVSANIHLKHQGTAEHSGKEDDVSAEDGARYELA